MSEEMITPTESSKSLRSRSEIIQNDQEHNRKRALRRLPEDGSCLFWSVTLAYLIPVKNDDVAFEMRYKDWFGNDENVISNLERVRTSILNFNSLSHSIPKDDDLENLVKNNFRKRVVDFMERNLDEFKYFPKVADEQCRFKMRDAEMHAISLMLNCKLDVDAKSFPVLSHDEEISKDNDKITLKLIRAKCLPDNLQNTGKYHYMLGNSIIRNYREMLINNTFKWLEKYSTENSKTYTRDQRGLDHSSTEYNYNNTSKICSMPFELKKFEDTAKNVDSKVKFRNNQALLDVNELGILIEMYQVKVKLPYQPINKNNVQILYNLFHNPKHVAGIFSTLKHLPKNKNLLKVAFKLLTHVIVELYDNKSYDLILEILNVRKVECVKDYLLRKDSSDLDALQFLRIATLAKSEPNCNEDTIMILKNIKDRIKASSALGKSIDDADKFHFTLLISSDIAYIKHKMGKCEESYKEYKDLHDKIIRYIGINTDVSRLSFEIYYKVLQSEKYLAIVNLNKDVCNILHIRGDIAHELICVAEQKEKYLPKQLSPSNKYEFDEVLQHYADALNLYEEILKIKRFDTETVDIKKTMNDIAFVNNKLADLKASGRTNTARLSEALSHLNKAIGMGFLVLRVEENDCPVNYKNVKVIMNALINTAFAYNKMGLLKSSSDSSEEARRCHKNALHIYQRLYVFQRNTFGEDHEFTLKTKKKLYYTHNNARQN